MKKKQMVMIVTQEGNCTRFETVGDDLNKELLNHYYHQIAQLIH